MTLEELQSILDQQIELVIEKLIHGSYIYNKESDDGSYKSLPIDEGKFKQIGRESKYPNDYNVLIKYLK